MVVSQLSGVVLTPTDHRDILSQALSHAASNSNASVLHAVWPLIPKNRDNSVEFRCALQGRFASEVVEILQPAPRHHNKILDQLASNQYWKEILYWSHIANDPVLDQKIVTKILPLISTLTYLNNDVERLNERVRAHQAIEQSQRIYNEIHAQPSVLRTRKI